MKRKLHIILTAVLIALMTVTPVMARGAISLNGSVGASWPLHLDGDVYGVGGYTQGIYITLTGFGDVLDVTCISPGGNEAPGQNPGKISVTGTQEIGKQDITKKGTAEVQVNATDPVLEFKVCPNKNWDASFVIDWDYAEVWVYDAKTGDELLYQKYVCEDPDAEGHTTCYLTEEVSFH